MDNIRSLLGFQTPDVKVYTGGRGCTGAVRISSLSEGRGDGNKTAFDQQTRISLPVRMSRNCLRISAAEIFKRATVNNVLN